jgi:succinate dehydrogenase / fumarate reductase cytochrome b subunit
MSSRIRLWESSVGTKILIGLTGLFLFIYLIVHIAGNILVFAGPDTFNQYSSALVGNPIITAIEVVLVLAILLHIYKTITMYLANRRARPLRYTLKRGANHTSKKSLASSTMIVSGLWLLVFIIIHVRAFRFGLEYERAGVRDLYRVEFENLSNPLMVAFYVLSMVIVGSHLWHGVWSALQSLGVNHPKWTPRLRAAGQLFAILIAGGFIAIVLWVYANQPGQVVR